MIQAAPPGWRLQVHDVLVSTQDTAIAAAYAGGADHLAVLAREQSAGRGSYGRQWTAPRGNLNLSLVLEHSSRPAMAPLWSLLSGVALHTAVVSLAEVADRLRLKWPNDLMLGRAKLGGILIDSVSGGGGGRDWVVIGIGVNLESAPTITGRETACLGGGVKPDSLASAILRHFEMWREEDNFTVRQAWLAMAHPVGTELRVVSPTGERIGAFAGLSESGGLLLDDDIRPIMSAQIDLNERPPSLPGPGLPWAKPIPYSLAPCS